MKNDVISDSISILTGSFAIANIEHILSIVILVISILNILFNALIKIIKHIKNKEYDLLDDDFNGAKEELQNLQEKEKEK